MSSAGSGWPWRTILRVVLAGPLVLITSIVTVSGSALWLPAGAAGINHLMLPPFLFPAVLAVLFLHACLDRKLARAYAIHLALLSVGAFLIIPRLG